MKWREIEVWVFYKKKTVIAHKAFGDLYFVPQEFNDVKFEIINDKIICSTKIGFEAILDAEELSFYYLTKDMMSLEVTEGEIFTKLKEVDEVIWELD